MADSDDTAPIPTFGRVLGIDFGTVRVGLSISDTEQRLAVPLDTYQRMGEPFDSVYLKSVITEYGVAGLVVGLPIHMNGAEGVKATEARQFGQAVADRVQLPVAWYDERFSSAMADDHMRDTGVSIRQRKGRRDAIAAAIILQSWLDFRSTEKSGNSAPAQ